MEAHSVILQANGDPALIQMPNGTTWLTAVLYQRPHRANIGCGGRGRGRCVNDKGLG
jgi:hypothetical protein